MAKILITGGAGYIGSVISNLALQAGFEVLAVDLLWFKKDIPLAHLNNSSYRFLREDIAKISKNLLKDIDYVIHTAAIVGEPASNKYPELTKRINQKASISLINKCRQSNVKGFVFFSTCSNYGITDGTATENSPLRPLSLYAKTKVGVENYLLENSKGLDWIICRLSTVYGVSPRMRFDLTVNDFALNAYLSKKLDVFLPYTYRPYIHVYDLAKSILLLINDFKKVKNNIFNIGFNQENHQKIRIAEAIKKFIPGLEIKLTEKGSDLRNYKVDFTKMNEFLGIKNSFSVDDGVKQVINMLESGLINNPKENFYYNTLPDLGDLN